MKRLILFDIDGTLTSHPVGHIEAHAVAYQKVFGILGSIYMIDYQGKPDLRITKEVLLQCGVPEAEIEAKLSEHFDVMGYYYDMVRQYVKPSLLPGVREILETLGADPDNLIGLVTGNLERIAYGKLEAAGIRDYFKTGGFGNESYDRADLIPSAAKKAAELFDFHPDATFVIGDTPQDILAGIAARVTTIGITTGFYDTAALQESGATTVLTDLVNLDILKQALKY